jgi:hypothetical protein
MTTTHARPASSRPNPHTTSPRTRSRYARAAVFSSFRARDAKALDYDGFQDRPPCDEPIRLDPVAAKVTGDAGQLALDYWLREAVRTDGEEHEVALQIAKEIATMINVPWAEVMSGEMG